MGACDIKKVYLDFTGVYADKEGQDAEGLHLSKQDGCERPEDRDTAYLNLREIRGTDMYCTPEAQTQIRARIRPFGPAGIHYLDSGNYHYMSKLFAEMIQEDFCLLLFDHHTDMQKPLMEDLLSCGGWAASLADSCRYLRQIMVIGPPEASMGEIDLDRREKLITVSEEEVLSGDWEKTVSQLRTDLPVYVSIDRDVLDPAYAATNWDQGQLTPEQIRQILEKILPGRRLLGADLCGELSDGSVSFVERFAARRKNEEADEVWLANLK